MSGISKVTAGGKEILCIDYSDLKEAQMMALASEALRILLTDNKPARVLHIVNERNYTTAKVMRHLENEARQSNHLVKKRALIGLNESKKLILKGFNLILKTDIQAFETRDEAIAYLVKD